jgi:PGF-CTERM protein
MQRYTVLVVVVLILAGPAGVTAAAPPPEDPTTDSGPVAASAAQADLVTLTIQLRTDDGDPVGNAQVNVSYDGGRNTTRSFSNGQALVDVPEGVDVTVRVDHPRYVRNTPFVVQNVGPGEEIEVPMFLKSVAVVEVNDSSSMVEDATVTLRKTSTGTVAAEGRTDSNGEYRSPEIEAGAYVVTVVKDFYSQNTLEFEATPGTAETQVPLSERTVNLNVRVEDDHFDPAQAVSDATIEVLYEGQTLKTARTGANGNTVISVGVNAQYTIRATKDGYGTAEQAFFLGEDDRSFVYKISRERDLQVTAVNNRVIAGENVLVRVRNAYAEPVEGVTVLRNGSSVATTGGSGEATVPIPERGTFELSASSNDGEVTSGTVLVQGVQAATATATSNPTTTAPPSTTSTPESVLPQPGFGPAIAVFAFLTVAFVLTRRRD